MRSRDRSLGLFHRWPGKLSGFILLALALLFASRIGLLPAPPGATASPDIRAATLSPIITQEAVANGWAVSLQGGSATNMTLRNDSTWGIFNSPVYQADFPFNAVALSWKARTPPGSQAVLEVRASPEGQNWSEWFTVEPLDGIPANSTENKSQVIVARGRFLQYSVTLYAEAPEFPPSVGEIKITYIDSSQGPSTVQSQAVGTFSRSAQVTMPAVISRAGWGSPEPDSSDRWPPEYREWRKVIIHDTITKNNDPNPAATVRAIWYYHANTNGWGDIGYNFLIDPDGNIYEGRYGGENVAGGHALPCYNYGSIGIALLGDYRYAEVSPAMEEALLSLLAAKSYQHNIDPLGSGYFGERTLNNIFAHRDVYGSCGNSHTDPGAYAYDRLPEFRGKVWDRLPNYGENWGEHNSPQRMLAGASTSVAITVQNKGRAIWSSSEKFRLGYRWFRQDGTEVFQAGGGPQYATLPTDIPFGQSVMFVAQVTAPASGGAYTLRWDMVQDGVTWFGNQGNATLDVAVTIDEPTYIAQLTGQSAPSPLFAGSKTTAWFELKNVGTATWYRSGANPVKLGTWSPADRASALATAGDWDSPARPTNADQDVVLPGQTVRFTFVATAPSQPGLYSEHFRLVTEGKGWFAPDMRMDFTVVGVNRRIYLPEVFRDYRGGW